MYNSLMEMEPLIVELNNFTNNEYKFSIKSAVLDSSADFCVIEILYIDGVLLSKQKKDEIVNFALNLLPKSYKYEINFIKNFISEERIFDEFSEYMQKNFPSVTYELESVKCENKSFEIKLKIDNLSLEHIKQKNLNIVAANYFKKLYEDYDFKCTYVGDEVYNENEIELLKQNYTEEEVNMLEFRKIEVSDQVLLVGEDIENAASYVKDYTTPTEDIVFCGKIKDIKPIVIKRKLKPSQETDQKSVDNNQEESNENITEIIKESAAVAEEIVEKQEETGYQRKLYKFTLEDFTGSVSCVFFSNKENQSKLEKLEKGSEVIVRGILEEDKYSGGVSMRVKHIAYCKLPDEFEEYIVYRNEKPFYEFVEPEKVVMYEQDDLTSFMIQEETPKHLQNKTFVCYDFETTGLHFEQGDKIIEIGAVKIENGKITEKFMTYVDPQKHIPAESSAISGIVDEDVKGAPVDSQALQDFYKFTRGSVLIGYNILNFDNVFLRGQGKACRWNFDNDCEDVYHYAQKYVHGVKNYKLGTIAAKLGVTLDNAHRAVYDAMATAEVFIKLCKMIKE